MGATARVLLFAGLPDPEWAVTDDQVARLLAIWHALEPALPPTSEAPRLGYRGVELHLDGGVSFTATKGLVTRASGRARESRRDGTQTFEKAVIGSAPAGLLPPAAGEVLSDLGFSERDRG